MDQLWLFRAAHLLRAARAGLVYRWLSPDEPIPLEALPQAAPAER